MASFVLMAVILVTNFEAELNPIIPSIEFPNDINIRKGIFTTSLILFLISTNGRTKKIHCDTIGLNGSQIIELKQCPECW